uniref:RGS domain-containing protein n=1 Tax=Meloidogyne hapla TaxID=6305 RepID=A0A1I8BTQ5_MELHA
MVKRLLQTEESRLESLGTELFQRHINLHYDVGTLYKEYNIIAKKFVEFMGRENENDRRLNGFTGITDRHQENDLQKSVVSFSPDSSKINTKIKNQNFMDILELIQMSIEMSKTRNDIKLIGEYQANKSKNY